jgi:hypothetical protein
MRWIKMRVELVDDPAVVAIAEATGLDEFGVVGRLHRLWSWADVHTVDGNARGVTRAFVDRYLNCTGFADSMVKAGWLSFDGELMTFPSFQSHNGETGKQKALTAKRVANHKAKGNAKVTPPSLPERYPPEHEHEEEQIPAKQPAGAFAELTPADLDDAVKVEAWRVRQSKKRKPVIPNNENARIMVHAAAVKAISAEANATEPVGLFGWLVSDASRWSQIPERDVDEARRRIADLTRGPPVTCTTIPNFQAPDTEGIDE